MILLDKLEKKHVGNWKQNEFFASLHHHALCASREGSFEMRRS